MTPITANSIIMTGLVCPLQLFSGMMTVQELLLLSLMSLLLLLLPLLLYFQPCEAGVAASLRYSCS